MRTMRANGDNEGAKRELRKAKMSKAYKMTNDKNRFFIDYCLTHHSYTEGNIEMCKSYLRDVEGIFKNEDIIESMKLEYCKYLWMNTNLNYKDMDIKDIVKDMTYVHDYYISIKEFDTAISALINIFYFEGSKERIIESLRKLLQCDKISDWTFIESILEGCEEINHDLYIKALELVNEYNVKINIDVV